MYVSQRPAGLPAPVVVWERSDDPQTVARDNAITALLSRPAAQVESEPPEDVAA
jgi:hypothetical protein